MLPAFLQTSGGSRQCQLDGEPGRSYLEPTGPAKIPAGSEPQGEVVEQLPVAQVAATHRSGGRGPFQEERRLCSLAVEWQAGPLGQNPERVGERGDPGLPGLAGLEAQALRDVGEVSGGDPQEGLPLSLPTQEDPPELEEAGVLSRGSLKEGREEESQAPTQMPLWRGWAPVPLPLAVLRHGLKVLLEPHQTLRTGQGQKAFSPWPLHGPLVV